MTPKASMTAPPMAPLVCCDAIPANPPIKAMGMKSSAMQAYSTPNILAQERTPTELIRCITLSLISAIIFRRSDLSSPTTPARRLNPNPFAFVQPDIEFARQLFYRPIQSDNASLARCTFLAALQSPGPAQTPVGQQGNFRIGQHLNFSYDPVPPAVFAAAPTPAPQ